MAIDADLKKALNGTGVPGLFGPKTSEWALGTVIDEMHDELGGTTALSSIALDDNTAAALDIAQSTTSYLKFTTTNDAERVTLGKLLAMPVQTIDMADVQVALVLGTAGAGQVKLTGQILFVDANSGTTEDLLLPPEASCTGLVLFIINTGGEDIVVKEDGDSTTICTVSSTECAFVVCNGTAWKGGVVTTT